VTGARLERLARRVLREDTYRLIVAPAIADLQFEAPLGSHSWMRACVGVWLAIVGALGEEVRHDFRNTCTRPVIARAAIAGMFAIALQGALFMWMWSFNPLERPVPFLLLLPALVSGAWPAAMLPTAAILARTRMPGARRVVLIASTAVAAVILVAADQGVTETNQMFREEIFAAAGARSPERGAQERTLAELWPRNDREARVSINLRLSILGLTPAWAMLGLALARSRWFVVVAVGLLAYSYHLFSPVLASPEDAARLPTWSPWIPVGLTFVTAGILRAVYARRAGKAGPEPRTAN
jgi:hypothetical protein